MKLTIPEKIDIMDIAVRYAIHSGMEPFALYRSMLKELGVSDSKPSINVHIDNEKISTREVQGVVDDIITMRINRKKLNDFVS